MTHPSGCWWLERYRELEQQWRQHAAQGQQHLAKMADAIQKTTYMSGDEWGEFSGCTRLHDAAEIRLWELAQRNQQRMHTTVKSMGEIYSHMAMLLNDQGLLANQATRKLTTCSYQRYETFLLEILDMYEKELAAKALIANDALYCQNHTTLTLYIASWQMQPHVDTARIKELQELVENDWHYRGATAS